MRQLGCSTTYARSSAPQITTMPGHGVVQSLLGLIEMNSGPHRNVQNCGVAWTIAIGVALVGASVYSFGAEDFFREPKSSLRFLLLLAISQVCLLVVFLYYRTGRIIAYGTLLLATLMIGDAMLMDKKEFSAWM